MKRGAIGCLTAVLLVIGLLSLPYLLHDFGRRRFRSSFAEIAHLPSSMLLHEFSNAGLLEGNGDHCDYLAAQYRETDQSPEEVLRHYANSRVRRVDPSYETGSGTDVPVHIEFPEIQHSDISPLTDASMLAAVQSKRSRKTLYLVYSIDVGYPPNFDWRCY